MALALALALALEVTLGGAGYVGCTDYSGAVFLVHYSTGEILNHSYLLME